MRLFSLWQRLTSGVGLVLLTGIVAGCAESEPSVDEYGWVDESFEDLVEREMELRETVEWYPPPVDIEPERFVDGGEAEEVHESCVRDAGWQGIAQAPDVMEVPAEQRDDAERAYWECVARFPTDPRTIGTFAAEEMPENFFRAMYEDEQSLRECLEDEGLQISTGPSFEIYLDVQRSGDPIRLSQEAQHPHIEVQRVYGVDVYGEVKETCPAGDPSRYMPEIPEP